MKILISLSQAVFFSSLLISSSTLASEIDAEKPSFYIKNLRYNVTRLDDKIVNSIEETLKELSQIELGGKLIGILNDNLEKKGNTILAKPGDMLSFDYDNNNDKQHILSINVEKAYKELQEGGCIGKLSNVFNLDVFEIGTSKTPFLYGIAHELIHAKHYLQEPELYKTMIRTFNFSLWDIYNDNDRGESLWKNLEEQRTVIGYDCDGISELTLRLSQSLGIRYAYQASDEHFYEDATIIKYIHDFYKINEDIYNILKRDNWNFDVEKALVCDLNTKNFKGANEDGYKKKRETNSQLISIDFNQSADKQKKFEEMRKRLEARKKKK